MPSVLLSGWIRAIRIRFLLSSVIAVSGGLALTFWKFGQIDLTQAALTYAGVVMLHASVDLLNDYWDYKRGIDQQTIRTKFSGGTGVLPENILTPKSVYIAGISFLIIGSIIGAYFVALRGVTIAAILGFAVISIYFYSTRIVNSGLGELFVAIKGAMIVLGTAYVQSAVILPAGVYVGAVIGLLSATVLFINSFPDYSADLSKGRKTLLILVGKKRGAAIFPFFFVATYVLIASGILFGFTKIYSIVCFASAPFAVKATKRLHNNGGNADGLVQAMSSTVTYSRLTGALLVASLIF